MKCLRQIYLSPPAYGAAISIGVVLAVTAAMRPGPLGWRISWWFVETAVLTLIYVPFWYWVCRRLRCGP